MLYIHLKQAEKNLYVMKFLKKSLGLDFISILMLNALI